MMTPQSLFPQIDASSMPLGKCVDINGVKVIRMPNNAFAIDGLLMPLRMPQLLQEIERRKAMKPQSMELPDIP